MWWLYIHGGRLHDDLDTARREYHTLLSTKETLVGKIRSQCRFAKFAVRCLSIFDATVKVFSGVIT
jgi:hypothetical protein